MPLYDHRRASAFVLFRLKHARLCDTHRFFSYQLYRTEKPVIIDRLFYFYGHMTEQYSSEADIRGMKSFPPENGTRANPCQF